MKPPPPPPVKELTGSPLLAYYGIARRANQPLYDESWLAPHFSKWRKGKRKRRRPGANTETVFDRLVRLGVLDKIKGPIPREPHATPLHLLQLPETTYDGRDYEP